MSWYTKVAQQDSSQSPETLEMDAGFQTESDPTERVIAAINANPQVSAYFSACANDAMQNAAEQFVNQLMNDNELLEVSEAAQIHGEIDYKLLAKTLLQKANW